PAAGGGEGADLPRRIDQGGDPLGERKDERTSETVADLAERFLAEHGARLRSKTALDYRRIIIRHVLPTLGRHKVKAVTFTDIDRLHRRISEPAPCQADPYVAVCCKMFS